MGALQADQRGDELTIKLPPREASHAQRIDYSSSEIDRARRALTLAVKLSHRSSLEEGTNSPSPLGYRALATGLLVAESGAPVEVIQAAFLSESLCSTSEEVTRNHREIIKRKFPKCVPILSALMVSTENAAIAGSSEERETILRFARDIVAIRDSNRLPNLHRIKGKTGEGQLSDLVPPAEFQGSPVLVRAIEIAQEAYRDVERKRGREWQPMMQHAVDVALIVCMGGGSRELVAAGLLHDILEGYKKVDGEVIERGHYQHIIRDNFGADVLSFVEAVTEPPKSHQKGNWEERKTAVLEQISDKGADVALLLTASKISTFGEGNKLLYVGGKVADWSSGTLLQNASVLDAYLQFAKRKGVNGSVVALLEREAGRFTRQNSNIVGSSNPVTNPQ